MDPHENPMQETRGITLLIGNPKPNSRTLDIARQLAKAVSPRIATHEIDLAHHSGALFDWSSDEISRLVDEVRSSRILIVASPTYKGAYTGLLKAFLDRIPENGLASVCVIPLMTGGSAAHSLAPDVTLRPLLAILGATIAGQSLYVNMEQFDQVGLQIQVWSTANIGKLEALLP